MFARGLGEDSGLVISSMVYFMAEMVKLLSQGRKVVIPDASASCSIAEGMNAATVRRIRSVYPNGYTSLTLIGYIFRHWSSPLKSRKRSDVIEANALAGIRTRVPAVTGLYADHYITKAR